MSDLNEIAKRCAEAICYDEDTGTIRADTGYIHYMQAEIVSAMHEAVAARDAEWREKIEGLRPPRSVLEPEDRADRYWLGYDDALSEALDSRKDQA